MRKIPLILSVAALVFGVAGASIAQGPPQGGPGKGGQGGPGGRRGPDIDKMLAPLNLNAKQKAAAKKVYEESFAKMRGMFKPGQPPSADAREKFAAMRKERDAKLQKILTPAQFKKLEEIRKQMRAQRGGGPGGPGGRPGGGKGGA